MRTEVLSSAVARRNCPENRLRKGVPSNDVTHVGVRLEYPSESAIFMQSVRREMTEPVSVITMEVLPVKAARAIFIC